MKNNAKLQMMMMMMMMMMMTIIIIIIIIIIILSLTWPLGVWPGRAHRAVRQTGMLTNSVWQQVQKRPKKQRT